MSVARNGDDDDVLGSTETGNIQSVHQRSMGSDCGTEEGDNYCAKFSVYSNRLRIFSLSLLSIVARLASSTCDVFKSCLLRISTPLLLRALSRIANWEDMPLESGKHDAQQTKIT